MSAPLPVRFHNPLAAWFTAYTCRRIRTVPDPVTRQALAVRVWDLIDRRTDCDQLWRLMAYMLPEMFADPCNANSIRRAA